MTTGTTAIFSEKTALFLSALVAGVGLIAGAQPPLQPASAAAAMSWRLVGPFRGGRVLAVAGVPGQPHTYYFGAAGGGLWKTTDGGLVWAPLFDAQSVQSIGALAVAPSNPDVIYAGTGEADWRSDLSSGNGMYRSADAGHTWQHLGLDDTRHIARISIDPANPDVVLVAAMGHAYAANPDRGVYRTSDGGRTWQKVLFTSPDVGAIDVVRQPSDSRIVYAALWRARRTPWSRYPPVQGPGGGIYKSLDGGATWTKLSSPGLPSTIEGRIGLAVGYGSQGSRVYALIEADKAGMYRSDDAGAHWDLVSTEPRITGRAWYFAEVIVDPKNADIVYAPNVGLNRSTDGGRTWTPIKGAPGGDDYHALWIDPSDSSRMITGVDQGATISVDAGVTWSSWYNQPTAQFYHVAVDNGFPYRIYGAQQDSGTVGITSRGNYGAITPSDWETVGGGESGYIVPDPDDPNVVIGGNTNGGLFRFVRSTGQSHEIVPRVAADFGASRRDATYRYTWTSPIAFSVTKPRAIFFGSQYLLKSTDQGQTWSRTSADLSRHGSDVTTVPSGGAMVQKLAAAEAVGVVYTVAPSTLKPGLIWAGTDDGQIHVTRDDGSTWQNVTPSTLTAWSKVSMLEASPHDAATAYAAIDRHRLDDYTPHILVTHDEGKTWAEIAKGIPDGTFVRAVREDPVRKGLLFAGTESGVYVSDDAGQHWESLQLNLPRAPIHDLVVHDNDLIVATHGRSFWVLDDLSPLRQMDGDESGGTRLLKPSTTIRVRRSVNTDTPLPPETPMGQNPPDGAVIDYRLDAEPAGEVSLEILDASGALVRRFSTRDPQPPAAGLTQFPESWLARPKALPAHRGMNRFVWDLRYPTTRALRPEFTIAALPGGTPALPEGPQVIPGTYTVKLTVNGQSSTQPLTVKMDPRVTASTEDLTRLFDLERKIAHAIDDAAQAIETLRASKASGQSAAAAERALVRLNEGLADLLSGVDTGDVAPTAAASQAFADFRKELDQRMAEASAPRK